MNVGIEEHLNDVFMQVDKEMKHRMDALEKKRKTTIGPLTEEYVHYCELEHGIILGKDGVEEGLAKSLMKSWESSDQQKNVLITESMGDENLNIFEINELCISVGVTCDEPCEVVPEEKEEEGEYPCILDMDQSQNFVLELKDEMTWSRGDNQRRTLAYFDNDVGR